MRTFCSKIHVHSSICRRILSFLHKMFCFSTKIEQSCFHDWRLSRECFFLLDFAILTISSGHVQTLEKKTVHIKFITTQSYDYSQRINKSSFVGQWQRYKVEPTPSILSAFPQFLGRTRGTQALHQ